jgi:4-amino-4-deoxy-L-arabinose transferase-like glycosyltransferase
MSEIRSRPGSPASQTHGLRGIAFWAAIIGLLLLSAALMWNELATHEVLGRDENVTIVKLDQPSVKAVLDASRLKFTGQPSNTQPLYFVLLYWFWPLVERSAFMLRFLSSAFGLLTIALTYKLGETLFDREAGLVGALLTSVLMLHVQYSQIARPYTLLAALSLASAYFLVRALRTNRSLHWAGFVLTATLNFYNHYNAVFVLAAEGLFTAVVWLATLISMQRKKQAPRRLLGPVLSFLMVGILCAPGLVRLFGLPWVGLEGQAETGGKIAIELSLSFFRNFMYKIGLPTGWLQNLIVALMGLGLVASLYRRRWQAALLSVLWISLPFIVLSLMKSPRPFEERYLIFGPPVAFLLVGQGVVFGADLLNALGRRWSSRSLRWAIIIALSAGLALLVGRSLNTYYAANRAADHLGQTVEVVERQARSGDVIVISPRSFVRPLAVEGADVLYLREHLSPAELDDLASRYQRMWIVHTSFIPPAELQEPLDQWVQTKPEILVRVPIKAVNVLTFGIVSPTEPEADLKDEIAVMEDFSQNSSGGYKTWARYNLLADAYQALGDHYASQGESSLAAEYWDKAEEARTAVPPP